MHLCVERELIKGINLTKIPEQQVVKQGGWKT